MWNHFCGHQNLNENNNSFPRSCSLFKVKILLYTLVGSILLSVLIVPSGRSSFHFKICLVNSLKSITSAPADVHSKPERVFHQAEEKKGLQDAE